MKLISWNVNGIRACIKKGFLDFISTENPDIFCLQEIKASKEQACLNLAGYYEYINPAEKKGYSGTAIYSKAKALNFYLNFPSGILQKYKLTDEYGDTNSEGRITTVEFKNFFLVNVYTPNSKEDLSRIPLREENWDKAFLEYLKNLEAKKSVIACGDFNVAHKEIDIYNAKGKDKSHGFTKEERVGMDNLLSAGFIDTFRMFETETGHFSWWSPFRNSREKNLGWRIDYFLVSSHIKNNITNASIYMKTLCSDHAPISLELENL